jgi:hypothetical protein
VTLIAVYSSGDGARFWSSQSRQNVAADEDPSADPGDARDPPSIDHDVDRPARGAQERGGFFDGEQNW